VGVSEAQNHPNWDPANPPANVTATDPLFLKVGFPLKDPWEAGKSYIYVLHLGDPNTSGGYVTDPNFVDKDGNATIFPAIRPDEVNKPIINPTEPANNDLPIGFDITVSEWGGSDIEIGMD
jgi:hypothetical protein